ncbi:MAG: glutathione synthase, partial [Polaromonas sp.]|nr:glutathione synthase [Polaromonas sp.]
MNILFIADPLESFKIYKDTTFTMMREAQKRGHRVSACEPQDLMWQRGAAVMAHVRDITLTGDKVNWFEDKGSRAV